MHTVVCNDYVITPRFHKKYNNYLFKDYNKLDKLELKKYIIYKCISFFRIDNWHYKIALQMNFISSWIFFKSSCENIYSNKIHISNKVHISNTIYM